MTGLPWELLYADDLVLLADSEEDLKRKLQRWKSVDFLKFVSRKSKVPLWGVW